MHPSSIQVWAALNEETLAYLKAELDFFDDVTNVSGKLYPVPKDERKSAAVNFVREVHCELPSVQQFCPCTQQCHSLESIVWCRRSAFPEMHHVLAVGGEICLRGSILFVNF